MKRADAIRYVFSCKNDLIHADYLLCKRYLSLELPLAGAAQFWNVPIPQDTFNERYEEYRIDMVPLTTQIIGGDDQRI